MSHGKGKGKGEVGGGEEGRYSDKLTNQPRVIFQDFLLQQFVPCTSVSPSTRASLTTNNTLAADSKWHFHPPSATAAARVRPFVPALLLLFPSFRFLGYMIGQGPGRAREGRREGGREGDIRSFQSRSG